MQSKSSATPEDLYGVLGMPPFATTAELRDAYRRLVQVHHPDRGGNPWAFHRVAQAYEVLGDPTRRAKYDAQRYVAYVQSWQEDSQWPWQEERAPWPADVRSAEERGESPGPLMLLAFKVTDWLGPKMTQILPVWAWLSLVVAIPVALGIASMSLSTTGTQYAWLSYAYYLGPIVGYGSLLIIVLATARYLADQLHDRLVTKSKDIVR